MSKRELITTYAVGKFGKGWTIATTNGVGDGPVFTDLSGSLTLEQVLAELPSVPAAVYLWPEDKWIMWDAPTRDRRGYSSTAMSN